jgi:hypothetical protein
MVARKSKVAFAVCKVGSFAGGGRWSWEELEGLRAAGAKITRCGKLEIGEQAEESGMLVLVLAARLDSHAWSLPLG